MRLKRVPIRTAHTENRLRRGLTFTGAGGNPGARHDRSWLMPKRNRQTLKTLLPFGLMALAAIVWRTLRTGAAAGADTQLRTIRTPMSEPAGDPAPPPPRSSARRRPAGRRLALVSAYTTLFFAGAAFTAVAGDQSARLPEEDAAWTQETEPAAPVEEAAAPTQEAAPAPAEEAALEAAPAAAPAPAATPDLETDLAPPARAAAAPAPRGAITP